MIGKLHRNFISPLPDPKIGKSETGKVWDDTTTVTKQTRAAFNKKTFITPSSWDLRHVA